MKKEKEREIEREGVSDIKIEIEGGRELKMIFWREGGLRRGTVEEREKEIKKERDKDIY